MAVQDVPNNFPQEFLSAVSGAQPKLAVERLSDGTYVESSVARRAERWEWCVDLLEQLVDHVYARVPPPSSYQAYLERVARSVVHTSFRSTRGISIAEAEWICKELRGRIETHERNESHSHRR